MNSGWKPSKINGCWVMARIIGEYIQDRPMYWWEKIRYFRLKNDESYKQRAVNDMSEKKPTIDELEKLIGTPNEPDIMPDGSLQPKCQVHEPEEAPSIPMLLKINYGLAKEIKQLQTRNKKLQFEIDRLNGTEFVSSTYSLIRQRKQLRQELAAYENRPASVTCPKCGNIIKTV